MSVCICIDIIGWCVHKVQTRALHSFLFHRNSHNKIQANVWDGRCWCMRSVVVLYRNYKYVKEYRIDCNWKINIIVLFPLADSFAYLFHVLFYGRTMQLVQHKWMSEQNLARIHRQVFGNRRFLDSDGKKINDFDSANSTSESSGNVFVHLNIDHLRTAGLQEWFSSLLNIMRKPTCYMTCEANTRFCLEIWEFVSS